MSAPAPYRLLAEFADADALLAAVRALADAGARGLEAYTPYPLEGLAQALAPRPSRLPWVVLAGGIAAGAGTFALELYSATHAYPINVGGRPDASWPMFLPPALEMGLLGAMLAGFVAMLWGNGLPQLFHPLFAVSRFERASHDGWFIVLPCAHDHAARQALHARLQALGARHVEQVPA